MLNLNPIGSTGIYGGSYYDFPTRHEFAGLRLITPPIKEPVSLDLAVRHCRIDGPDDDVVIQSYISAARQHCEDITRRGFLPQTWRLSLDGWRGDYIRLPIGPTLSVQAVRFTNSANQVTVLNAGADYFVNAEPEMAEVTLPYGGSWPSATLGNGAPVQIDFRIGYLVIAAQVTISGTSVTWTSGDLFDPLLTGNVVVVNGQTAMVLAVASPTALTLDIALTVGPNTLTINQLPAPITQSILMLVSHWYENREAVVVGHTSTISTKLEFAVNALLSPYKIYRF